MLGNNSRTAPGILKQVRLSTTAHLLCISFCKMAVFKIFLEE